MCESTASAIVKLLTDSCGHQPTQNGTPGHTQLKTLMRVLYSAHRIYTLSSHKHLLSLSAGGWPARHTRSHSLIFILCEAPSSLSFLLSVARFLLPQSSFPRSLIYLLKETGTEAKGFILKEDKLISKEINL